MTAHQLNISLLLLGGAILLQTGCDMLNARVAKRNAIKTAKWVSPALQVEGCGMVANTREGHCTLKGSQETLKLLVEKLNYTEVPKNNTDKAQRPRGDCFHASPYGSKTNGRWTIEQGTALYRPPKSKKGPWPSNTDNVVYRALCVRAKDGVARLSFEYPYG